MLISQALTGSTTPQDALNTIARMQQDIMTAAHPCGPVCLAPGSSSSSSRDTTILVATLVPASILVLLLVVLVVVLLRFVVCRVLSMPCPFHAW